MNIEKIINKEAVVINVFRGENGEDIEDLFNIERDLVFFDFSKTSFINSEFINKLVKIHKNREIRISGINDRVKNVFSSMGLLNIFKIV